MIENAEKYFKKLLKSNEQSEKEFERHTYLFYILFLVTILITVLTGNSNFNKTLLLAISIGCYGIAIVTNYIYYLVLIENNNKTIDDIAKDISYKDLYEGVTVRNKRINRLNYTIVIFNALGILSFIISTLV